MSAKSGTITNEVTPSAASKKDSRQVNNGGLGDDSLMDSQMDEDEAPTGAPSVFEAIHNIHEEQLETIQVANFKAGGKYILVLNEHNITIKDLCDSTFKASFIIAYAKTNKIKPDSAKRAWNRMLTSITTSMNMQVALVKQAYANNKQQLDKWLQPTSNYWNAEKKLTVSSRMIKYTFYKAMNLDTRNNFIKDWCYGHDHLVDFNSYKLTTDFLSLEDVIATVMDKVGKTARQHARDQWDQYGTDTDTDFSWPPADRERQQQNHVASSHASQAKPSSVPQAGAAGAILSDDEEYEDEEAKKRREQPLEDNFIQQEDGDDGGGDNDNEDEEAADADAEYEDEDDEDGKKKKKKKTKKTATQKRVRRFEFDGKNVQLGKITFKWFKELAYNQEVLGEVVQAVFEDLIEKSEADLKLDKRFYVVAPLAKFDQMSRSRIIENEHGKCVIAEMADDAAIGKQG